MTGREILRDPIERPTNFAQRVIRAFKGFLKDLEDMQYRRNYREGESVKKLESYTVADESIAHLD